MPEDSDEEVSFRGLEFDLHKYVDKTTNSMLPSERRSYLKHTHRTKTVAIEGRFHITCQYFTAFSNGQWHPIIQYEPYEVRSNTMKVSQQGRTYRIAIYPLPTPNGGRGIWEFPESLQYLSVFMRHWMSVVIPYGRLKCSRLRASIPPSYDLYIMVYTYPNSLLN